MHSSCFHLSLACCFSLVRERKRSARAGNRLEIRRRWRADWPLADHVGDPTDSHLCSRLVAFRTPVFAADARVCVRACVSMHACTLVSSPARLFSIFFSLSLSLSSPFGILRQLRAHHERTLHRCVYACEFYSRLRARFAEIYRVFLENDMPRGHVA